ncbi:hypothetical protein [Arthrobacter sp. ISL-72]|uniref:hypothetical protein n=1 Tax=Arthrobacter sp. ISL-72 TaxID=2819114 RepID=UPI001BEBBC2A|nr:hypothetical protein [Arthrobacter sp. ISL-72]
MASPIDRIPRPTPRIGTELPSHQPRLESIADELDDRPRAVLGFLTPREVFAQLINEDAAKTG